MGRGSTSWPGEAPVDCLSGRRTYCTLDMQPVHYPWNAAWKCALEMQALKTVMCLADALVQWRLLQA